MTTTLLIGSSSDALAIELVRRIATIAKDSVQARGVFTVAVSGGSMPKVFPRVSSTDVPGRETNSTAPALVFVFFVVTAVLLHSLLSFH